MQAPKHKSYDKHINCCLRRTTLFKFLKIIMVITEDTYNANFTVYHYYECLINDTCLNLISLTETHVSYKHISCTTHNSCAEKEYFQISDIYEYIKRMKTASNLFSSKLANELQ